MSDPPHLDLAGVSDGWVKVTEPDGRKSYVAEVKIAGCGVDITPPGEMTVACDDWQIVRDYHPTLLIEAATWYDGRE